MGWLSDAFDTVCDAVSSAVSTVADAVEEVVDTVCDTVEDAVDSVIEGAQDGVTSAVDWVADNGGSVLGGIASFIGGLINGGLEAAKDLFHDTLDIARDILEIGCNILRGDLGGVVAGIASLFLDIVKIFLDTVRFGLGGYFVGGIIDQFKHQLLRDFVRKLLNEKFTGNKLTSALNKVGLNGGKFGLPIKAYHNRFYLDSKNTPLWQWHNDGFINLYALANLHFSFTVFPRPRVLIKSVNIDGKDSLLPINRWQLSQYIKSKGKNSRIRIYAMSNEAIAEKLATSTQKCKQIGIRLTWNLNKKFSHFKDYSLGDHEIKSKDEYLFPLYQSNINQLERYLITSNLRNGESTEDDEIVALGAFRFKKDENGKEGFGLVASRNPVPFPSHCTTTGRTDNCCSTIIHNSNGELLGGGVIHRDVWPYDIMHYILIHEIGHYLGLCHVGHNPAEIMFKPDKNTNNTDWGLLSYYWDDEPHFTLDDAKNSWRFIVDQMAHCL